jgi:hypothetical protein
VIVIDAFDECTSTEIANLISLLEEALCEPDLPVVKILLTSRLEGHIRAAIDEEQVHPLVCETPAKLLERMCFLFSCKTGRKDTGLKECVY